MCVCIVYVYICACARVCGRVCVYKYIKCTLVEALRLCTGHTAHRGSIGIALLFLDHCSRKG